MAMAVGDEMMEGSVSTNILDFAESKQSEDALSAEDIAWLDSCLIEDPEISDESNWNTLKDALLEIFTSQPDLTDSAKTKKDGFHRETDIEILVSTEEDGFHGETDIEILPSIEEAETSQNPRIETAEQNDYITVEMIDALRSKSIFLPNYSEDLKEIEKETEKTDSSADLGIPVFSMEPSTDDIFKVWDLEFPDEEDELIKQLNKALTESSLDDSEIWKDLKDESLDDLISGIADLSLNQNSV